MRKSVLLSTFMAICMAACGGGGGGSASSPAPSVPGSAAPLVANLSTGAATNITNTLASLNGYFVNPAGRTTEAWFEWGTTVAYGNYTTSSYYGYAGGINQSTNISGLTVGTNYHYIFCARNVDGKVCGADKTFNPSPTQAASAVAPGPSDPVTNPKYFVLDATHVYWLQGGLTGSIWKRPLNGGTITKITTFTGLTDPIALAVDGSTVYWTEQGAATGAGTVMSAPLTGTASPYPVLASGLNNPQFVVVSAGYVYFTELGTWDTSAGLRRADGTIKRVPVAGGLVETLAANLNGPQSIQVDATHVYWVEVGNYLSGASSVKSVPLAGGSVTTLVSGLTGSQYIAIDAANVYYWSSYGVLSSVPLGGATGTNPIVQLASGISGTQPLASDASSIYWTEAANGGALKRLTKANGNVTVLTSGFSRPDWISVDASNVYWMQDDLWNGTVWGDVGAIFKTAK